MVKCSDNISSEMVGIMSPEHLQWLAMFLKRQKPDLQFLGSEGSKVEGHQSLACLASPLLAQVLAEQEHPDQMVTIALPATYSSIKAFTRICDSGGAGLEKNSKAALEVLGLLATNNMKENYLQVEKAKTSELSSDVDVADIDNFEDDKEIVGNLIKNENSPACLIKNENQEEYELDGNEIKAKLTSPKKWKLKCKRCSQTFLNLTALKEHAQQHREEAEDGGSEDSDGQPVDEQLAVEQKPETEYACKLGCTGKSGTFLMRGSLIRHYMSIHEKPHECCGDNFNDYKVFRKHLSSAHKSFQCAECAKTFRVKARLEKHQKDSHEIEAQKCPMCPTVTKNVGLHIRNCHTGELLTCSACTYSSRRKACMDAHFRRIHTDLDKKICPVCGETFKRLKQHLKGTMCGTGKKTEATLPCPRGCPKMFTLPSVVENHVRQVHDQIKDKLCPFCKYRTYSKFNLKLHVTKQHEGREFEKKQCEHCDKATFSLDYHMQTYHQDKI